jgi:hypothetical protein
MARIVFWIILVATPVNEGEDDDDDEKEEVDIIFQ